MVQDWPDCTKVLFSVVLRKVLVGANVPFSIIIILF